MTEAATPEQIAAERRHLRENLIQPGERVAAELARIADTLEASRRADIEYDVRRRQEHEELKRLFRENQDGRALRDH